VLRGAGLDAFLVGHLGARAEKSHLAYLRLFQYGGCNVGLIARPIEHGENDSSDDIKRDRLVPRIRDLGFARGGVARDG
jgi:hypothetical protein